MKVLVCITFKYREDRLIYLEDVVSQYKLLGENVDVKILTDTDNPIEIGNIRDSLTPSNSIFTTEIIVFLNLLYSNL